MNEFRGIRTAAGPQVWIYENGKKKCKLIHVVRHSPTGIEWGYGGSGPADLALSVLMEVLRGREVANALYQSFKRDYIAVLPWKKWSITYGEIISWIKKQWDSDVFLRTMDPDLPAKLVELKREVV